MRTTTRFLLGPAGSGKTHGCLAGVRSALKTSPDGPPLILLAPKQATFQLERQLLNDPGLPGYTRLHILSFERLADFILERLGVPSLRQLAEEGRVMVLRALLARQRDRLNLFRASARMPGFAQQLSGLLREFQRHHLSVKRLEKLAADMTDGPLASKLIDLALLLRAYQDWLAEHQLQDADGLLDAATTVLRRLRSKFTPASSTLDEQDQLALPLLELQDPKSSLHVTGLWLDGFAEMTPQELDLLAALLPFCEEATLAFCIESEPQGEISWLSTWAPVSQTFRQCFQRLAALPEIKCSVEVLKRNPQRNRFAGNAILNHLERHWTNPIAYSEAEALSSPPTSSVAPALRVATCATPEAEVTLAAREIRRFVRERPGRYREIAVLVRQLDRYHDLIRRVFTRFDIPFFLDRREPVSHHPLAELTRSALRLLAYDWRHEDWFGGLKTGLVHAREDDIDWLENEALSRGWEGAFWKEVIALPDNTSTSDKAEQIRQQIITPFCDLSQKLGDHPTGSQLAEALRELYHVLDVETTLTHWNEITFAKENASFKQAAAPAIHLTVLHELLRWLENLELGFAHESLSLREWLPIIEAGLGGLTAGVIPPALDQVLVGAIDRARNPDLRMTLLLGVNETVFPAPPAEPSLLTDSDRETLEKKDVKLGPNWKQRVGQERFYGYIACTRPRERLVLTFALVDADGKELNPSPFIAHLRRLFPQLEIERPGFAWNWIEAEHPAELGPLAASGQTKGIPDSNWESIVALPAISSLTQRLEKCAAHSLAGALHPELVELLYGPELRTSVSRLEQFATCPFKFLVHSGFRAEERKRFAVDSREKGSFQHEVLARFHAELKTARKNWRDITPVEARNQIGRIAHDVAKNYGAGLFRANDHSAFTAQSLTLALQDFIEVIVRWMEHYEFDPQAVELPFGFLDSPLPGWQIQLDEQHRMVFQGKIDRIDLAARGDDLAWCVVMDYKSSAKKIDPLLLEHGIQIQLPAYLAALTRLPEAWKYLGVSRLIPAGVFYVTLRGDYQSGGSRREVLANAEDDKLSAYKHTGRFNIEALPKLDRHCHETNSGQFNYRMTKEGRPSKNSPEAVEPAEFNGLLDLVEIKLREMGRRIYSGEAGVDPYRKGSDSACDYCDYAAICRIDPWTHEYRVLKKLSAPPSGSPSAT